MGKKRELNTTYGLDGTTYKTRSYNGYADDPHESAIVTIFEAVGTFVNIKPSILYTLAIGEGLGFTYLDYDRYPGNYNTAQAHQPDENGVMQTVTVPTSLKTDLMVDGFNSIGLDDFGSESSRYSTHLPASYNIGTLTDNLDGTYTINEADAEFGARTRVNELGANTESAMFRDMRAAVDAFGATVKHRMNLFDTHRREFSYGLPTDDEKMYWTYVYFQGEGRARRYLDNSGGLDMFTNQVVGQIASLARERVATWRYVLTFNIFTE